MNFLKRIFQSESARNRELATKLEIANGRIAVLEDQNTFLTRVNSYNSRHLKEVLSQLPEEPEPS